MQIVMYGVCVYVRAPGWKHPHHYDKDRSRIRESKKEMRFSNAKLKLCKIPSSQPLPIPGAHVAVDPRAGIIISLLYAPQLRRGCAEYIVFPFCSVDPFVFSCPCGLSSSSLYYIYITLDV